MARFYPSLPSLNAGQLSPLLEGRVDFQKYPKGLKLCENFIPLVQGPVTRRPGTYFVSEVKTSANQTALVRFEFSTTQAYILEFGDQYLRFYKNHAQITSGGPAYEISTPYTQANLFDSAGCLRLRFTQSADVLYIAHPSYAPRKLSRLSDTNWTLTAIDFTDGPYLVTNGGTTTITPSATTGAGITLTASASTFASTDVGRLVRIKHSSKWGYAKIVGYTSATVVTADVKVDFGSATASANWRLGVWSDTTGYPSAVAFYGDRLYWGGCTSYPSRIDGSNVGDYENFAPTSFAAGSTTDNTVIADDDAVAFTLNANEVNTIRGFGSDEHGLIVFTASAEWLVRSGTTNQALTPTNIKADQSTRFGSNGVQPLKAGNAHLFVQNNGGRKVREAAYVYEADGVRAPDMTIQSEDITLGGLISAAYQPQPQSIAWFARADGKLIGFTYERDQECLAWHQHTIGGTFGSGNAVVESVACIPNPTLTATELWMIVKRTIGGSTKRYIEYMTPFWDASLAKSDAHFVDCGLAYSGAAASSFSGLSHLNGETVDILADGAVRPQGTVSGGSVSLDRGTATKAKIGLHYTSNMWTERLDIAGLAQSFQGKESRKMNVVLRFWQTLGGYSGPSSSDLTEIVFRNTNDPMDSSAPLADSDKEIQWSGGYENEGRMYVRQDQPLPMTLLAIFPETWSWVNI